MNDTNRCRTCRHWGYNPGSDTEIVRVCQKIDHTGTVYRPFNLNGQLAATVDGEGFGAWLIVSPDFGCVLHEPHEHTT